MAPLLGKEMTDRVFLSRFCEMCTDPLFHVRKVRSYFYSYSDPRIFTLLHDILNFCLLSSNQKMEIVLQFSLLLEWNIVAFLKLGHAKQLTLC